MSWVKSGSPTPSLRSGLHGPGALQKLKQKRDPDSDGCIRSLLPQDPRLTGNKPRGGDNLSLLLAMGQRLLVLVPWAPGPPTALMSGPLSG